MFIPDINDNEYFAKLEGKFAAKRSRDRKQAACVVLAVLAICTVAVLVVAVAVFSIPVACLLYMLKGIKWLMM